MNKKNEEQKISTESSMSVDSKKRRKLLGAIAAGGAVANLLPSKWSEPVVDSVLLPAHAAMSPGPNLTTFSCTATGYLITGTFSESGSTIPTTGSSFSGNGSATAAEYTFALVTGSVSAVATFTGSGRGFYTFLSSTGTQFAPYIFDTTCAG